VEPFKIDSGEQKRYWREGDGAHRAWQVGPGYFADSERALLAAAALPATARLLEIGCGEGANLEHLGAAAGSAGVDFSHDKLVLAHRELPGLGFFRADATALPFPDGAFAAVLIRDLLHHVGDRQAVLGEAARVLGPGGSIAVIEPNRLSPLVMAQAALVPAERGALRSDAARLHAELAAAGLVDIVIDRAQPLPAARVLTHPALGLRALGRSRTAGWLFRAVDAVAARLMPGATWLYLVGRARRKAAW